jgi:L-lactate dehydrogenase complex protein LldG
MSHTREQLLAKLRTQMIEGQPLPEVIEGDWIKFDDPLAQFAEAIKFVGGVCTTLNSIDELPGKLAEFEQFRAAKRVFSAVSTVPGNVNLDETHDAHDLDNLDFVVYPGEFAVAENGAVWLTDRNLKHRVIFFITQFLVLVIRRSDMVHTMHEAYARAQPPQPGFGLFLSGPSKTADIEQSLVIGAHGCRELQVYIVP